MVLLVNIGEGEMIIAGIDLETGGAANCRPQHNFITEIGIALYDTSIGTTPVKIFNSLVKNEERIDQEMSEYTGITDLHCDMYGVEQSRVAQAAYGMLSQADMIVAHNGLKFDYPILMWWFDKWLSVSSFGVGKIMCDTMVDVPWHKNAKQKNLTYLAGFHEMYNPFPHRALTDVLTMMKLFWMYPLDKIIASAMTDFICVQALTSFDNKDLAKKRGFYWDSETKRWLKLMREAQFNIESVDYEFKHNIVPILELE